MNERFDRLSRTLAASTSRRGALKMIGASLAGAAAATVLRPTQGHAVCAAGQSVCGPTCCSAGVACLDPTNGICGCPPGRASCGAGCCPNKGDFCAFISGPCAACCPKGTTPCGRACCPAGVACLSASTATCGCPPNTILCGEGPSASCCPAGQPCPTDRSTCLNAGNLNHCLT
jgi:hypothetical protein